MAGDRQGQGGEGTQEDDRRKGHGKRRKKGDGEVEKKKVEEECKRKRDERENDKGE